MSGGTVWRIRRPSARGGDAGDRDRRAEGEANAAPGRSFSMKLQRALCVLSLSVGLVAVAYAKDMIDNREYKGWSECKPGSWVTLKTVSEFGGNKSESEMTTKLLEISADKATVETQMTMMVGDKPKVMPAKKRDIAAKIEKPEDKGEKEEKPKEGDEEIEVGGKKLKCHWMEMHSEQKGMVSDTKVWYSPEIPGHTAKMESKMSGTMKGTSTMEAVKWEKK
jgi:hypothetical protein